MTKGKVENDRESYEKELKHVLNEIVTELSSDPKSSIIKLYSFAMLCGIRRHLNQDNTIPRELEAIIEEQVTREIHDRILEICMHCKTYEDIKGIISQAREEEQPTIKKFLEDVQREVALKRLNAVLMLIKADQYVGQLDYFSLEELCELERYLTNCETIALDDKALIELAIQRAIEHTLITYPAIYENEDRMNELLEGANPLNKARMRAHIERYKKSRFSIH